MFSIREQSAVQACLDGGLSNNLSVFDCVRTITVNLFSGPAEISPVDSLETMADWSFTYANHTINVYVWNSKRLHQMSKQNTIRCQHAFFPPPRKVLGEYYARGYMDAYR